MLTVSIESQHREQMIDITDQVQQNIDQNADGMCFIFTQHTTCGLTINENADPDVQSDMLAFLRDLIPQYREGFKHFEHNSDAHIKSTLVGCSASVPISNGKLVLGRWQGIYLCEFDGPRTRKVVITIK